jgi:threonine dehydrogenase-like Zn-dependent dehydrogenase
MKAVCWYGTGDMRVETVPDPQIQDPRDAIVKITSTAICGSDLHLYNGFMPTMEKGDILGHVLRQAIWNCRKGGTISVPGVYVGFADKIPMGALMNKGLTLKTGQTHVKKYLPLLFEKIENSEIDPSFVITHEVPLEDAPEAYKMFRDKEDKCIKVV